MFTARPTGRPRHDGKLLGATTMREAIERSPEMQAILYRLEHSTTIITRPMSATKHRGRKNVLDVLIQQRDEMIFNLAATGITNATILRIVNTQGEARGWGTLHHERSVRRIIAKHYAKMISDGEMSQEDFGLRQAALAMLHNCVEKISLYTSSKKNWEPFEYAAALSTLSRAIQAYIEANNWNMTKYRNSQSK